MAAQILVRIAFDPEAHVWFIEGSDLPGLTGEAASSEALIERIPRMIEDLIEENGFDDGGPGLADIPVEIIASWHKSVHRAA